MEDDDDPTKAEESDPYSGLDMYTGQPLQSLETNDSGEEAAGLGSYYGSE